MQIITQQQTIRLWLLYKLNGVAVTENTNIKVQIKNIAGTVIVNQTMTETQIPGEYEYIWNTGLINYGEQFFVYYLDGDTVLTIDELYSDMIGNNGDGRAF